MGAHSTASGDASTAVGISADASGRLSTAMGVAASASGENSIALGAFSEATEDNTVSFGNTTVKRRLINLADGTAATDAATVGQMNAAAAHTLAAANTYADQGDVRTLNEAKAYTDSQIAAMGGGSKQMQEYADSGTAAAIAAASIPQAFAPGGSMLGAGLGHWRGETALSVGGSYMLPSGRVVLRGNASIANRGGSGGGVGVGIAF
nr:YadA-like family protein [Brevundimonas sp.]